MLALKWHDALLMQPYTSAVMPLCLSCLCQCLLVCICQNKLWYPNGSCLKVQRLTFSRFLLVTT
jgi:hypothetical protein